MCCDIIRHMKRVTKSIALEKRTRCIVLIKKEKSEE